MEIKKIKFHDTEIEKYKLHQHKSPLFIDKIDISKIVVSNKVSFGKKDFKYFIGYKDAKIIKSLCIFLPKMNGCSRDFDKTKYMLFLIKYEKLLGKYNEIWKKKSATLLKKDFPVNFYTTKNI